MSVDTRQSIFKNIDEGDLITSGAAWIFSTKWKSQLIAGTVTDVEKGMIFGGKGREKLFATKWELPRIIVAKKIN